MDSRVIYGFESFILPWQGRFIPCLRLVATENSLSRPLALCIHMNCAFDTREAADNFSQINCRLIQLKSKQFRDIEEQHYLRFASLSEFHPKEFYLDSGVAPNFVAGAPDEFLYFISKLA